MYIDIPVLKRCCFCLPLRPGLLAWSYIKSVVNILLLVILGKLLHNIIPEIKYNLTPVVILCILIFFIILDTVVGALFIISAHMKNYKLMKIYYIYCLITLILLILTVIGYLILLTIFLARSSVNEAIFILSWVPAFTQPAIAACSQAILYIYMVLLVRSEVLKLESNIQCKFVKTPVRAGDVEKKEETERTMYNRLTSDPGSVYSQCTIAFEE